MVRGEAIGSLGMTEPHAGSDLKAVRTQAVRDGDEFVINGQKVFISNGQLCDVVVLATGDGDFDLLVHRIRERHAVSVEVYGVAELSAGTLIRAADRFIPIEDPLLLGIK